MTDTNIKFINLTENGNDFNKKLLQYLRAGKYCDATLIVNGEEIAVHANILAASCHYFDEKFSEINAENESKQLTFENIDPEAFRLIIEYIYDGTLIITMENANNIFEIADILSISDIREKSQKILKNDLTISNCIPMWQFAQIENLNELYQEIMKFVKNNIEKIFLTDVFLKLEITDLRKMLDSIGSEIKFFFAIKKWCNHDPLRKQFLDSLLDYVPLACLPNELLKYEHNSISDVDLKKKFSKAIEIRKHIGSKKCVQEYSTLIAVGLYKSSENKIIEFFDIINHEWVDAIEIDYDIQSYATVLLDNSLVFIGGIVEIFDLNVVNSYNLKTGEMEILPCMKHARSIVAAVIFDKYIFVIAGFTICDFSVPYVEKYDTESKTWTDAAPLSIARYGCVAKVFNEKIYVVGGHNEERGFLREMEIYDPITDSWKTGAPMIVKRKAPGVAVIGNYLYAVSGNNNEQYLTSAERYDPQIDRWTLIESVKIGRDFMGAGNLMGKLVIAGGYTSNGQVEVYDEEDNEWKMMASLNRGREIFNLIEIPWHLAENILSKVNMKHLMSIFDE